MQNIIGEFGKLNWIEFLQSAPPAGDEIHAVENAWWEIGLVATKRNREQSFLWCKTINGEG